MSTRGSIGFRVDGKDKVTYNHSDSYPSWLGVQVYGFLAKRISAEHDRDKAISEMREQVRAIKLIDTEKDKPTAEDIERCKPYMDLHVGQQSTQDWYCLLRGAQGDLGAYLKMGLMPDGADFLKDSLFCEWAYIVNLDDNVLEVYRGFNKNLAAPGRYVALYTEHGNQPVEYYGVALITAIPLTDLPATEEEFLRSLVKPYYSMEIGDSGFWPPHDDDDPWEENSATVTAVIGDELHFRQGQENYTVPLSRLSVS